MSDETGTFCKLAVKLCHGVVFPRLVVEPYSNENPVATPAGLTVPCSRAVLKVLSLTGSVMATGPAATDRLAVLLTGSVPVSFDRSTTAEFVHTPRVALVTLTLSTQDCFGPSVIPDTRIVLPPGVRATEPLPQLFDIDGVAAMTICGGRSFVNAKPVSVASELFFRVNLRMATPP